MARIKGWWEGDDIRAVRMTEQEDLHLWCISLRNRDALGSEG